MTTCDHCNGKGQIPIYLDNAGTKPIDYDPCPKCRECPTCRNARAVTTGMGQVVRCATCGGGS